MKGIILAGGQGTRLNPLTKVTNKHLLPVYNRPMIYYPIKTLRNAGIKDIMIITGKESAGDFMNLLGSGNEFDINITYRLQDDADGICGALKLCEDFVNGDSIAVILGDNIFQDDFKNVISNFKNGALIFVKGVSNPYRFGVVEFDKDNNVLSIEEKPKIPKSNFAQTGLYLYDSKVFDYIKMLKPSARGEYEITDLNNIYLKTGRLKSFIVKGNWADAGTFESLYQANKNVYDKQEKK